MKGIRKLIAKLPIGLLNGKRFVFCFHDISNADSPQHNAVHYSTKVEKFKQQVDFFSNYCNVLSLEDLLAEEGTVSDKINISLTIDDGFKSVKSTAHEILKNHNFPYSLYINKEAVLHNQLWVTNLKLHENNTNYLHQVFENHLGDEYDLDKFLSTPLNFVHEFKFNSDSETCLRINNRKELDIYLNEHDINDLINEGVQIGSHTDHHYNLARCEEGLAHDEIVGNEEFIRQAFNVKSAFLALPFGKKNHYSNESLKLVEELGLGKSLSTNVNPIKRGDKLISRIVLTNESVDEVLFYMHRTHFKTYNL